MMKYDSGTWCIQYLFTHGTLYGAAEISLLISKTPVLVQDKAQD